MTIIKYVVLIFLAFSSGMIIAAGIFAFIAVIGVVPRMAIRTLTQKNIKIYETAIILGGICGTLKLVFDYHIDIGIFACVPSFFVGMFVGCVAVSIAEVLDVMPVFMRRARIKNGISIFIAAIAIGKALGSILYFCLPNFYKL
ncbi:MAG: stage V sporulation protein AB [Clostridia bacterium]|jgi:stage V sporulation protein AB|nr:stage V sporulation protein AB [Clostridia bacterium]MCI2001189.1 stage V sporulation protein AB [Clostridia bacterium]MCI2015879.1 stage V sporulation protein AB [Clostridia bacterium]